MKIYPQLLTNYQKCCKVTLLDTTYSLCLTVQKYIENLSIIYQTYIEKLSLNFRQVFDIFPIIVECLQQDFDISKLSTKYLKYIDNLSEIYRKLIKTISRIYWKYIENLSEIFRQLSINYKNGKILTIVDKLSKMLQS